MVLVPIIFVNEKKEQSSIFSLGVSSKEWTAEEKKEIKKTQEKSTNMQHIQL